MAGKIVADTLEHSTAGSIATNYVVNGSAKAWVNFNGTGTIAARDSLNVSGLVDDGTGLYTVNFANSMDSSDYSSTGAGGGTSGIPLTKIPPTNVVYNTSGFQLQTLNTASQATLDTQIIGTQNFGDLA
jgi:hypothetical protein